MNIKPLNPSQPGHRLENMFGQQGLKLGRKSGSESGRVVRIHPRLARKVAEAETNQGQNVPQTDELGTH